MSPTEAAGSSVWAMEQVSTQHHYERLGRATLGELRVLIVGGVPVGVLVAGVGSRLAMLVLRLTSPGPVRGRLSDDGFVIGRVTLGGTFNLLVLGAVVGVIGATAYRLVARRLVGPQWFRRFTIALASGVVVGSMLVHDDGIDFHALQPTWLAVGLFIGLPAGFGWAIGPAVDRARRSSASGWRWWLPPIVLLACFPPVLIVLVPLTIAVWLMVAVGRLDGIDSLRSSTAYVLAVRGAWLIIAGLGLLALVNDINAIR